MKIVIDTETTGLHPENGDELLQVAIADVKGNVLFNSRIRPATAKSWPEAMAVNHITPEMVACSPSVVDLLIDGELERIISSADTIIGYNTGFDLNFLELAAGIKPAPTAKIVDTMEITKRLFGVEKWFKLTQAAYIFGFNYKSPALVAAGLQAHDALCDVYATLHIYNRLVYLKECVPYQFGIE